LFLFLFASPGTSGAQAAKTPATNDIGLIVLPDGRRLAIAVFVTDSADPTTSESAIARIAATVYAARSALTSNSSGRTFCPP